MCPSPPCFSLFCFLPGIGIVFKVFLEVMNSVLMTGEIPGLFAKDEMMAMTADLRNSFLKVKNVPSRRRAVILQHETPLNPF